MSALFIAFSPGLKAILNLSPSCKDQYWSLHEGKLRSPCVTCWWQIWCTGKMLSTLYFPPSFCGRMWCNSTGSPLCNDSPHIGHLCLCFIYISGRNLASMRDCLRLLKYSCHTVWISVLFKRSHLYDGSLTQV
uniref:Uncharacterized protein n=1 Tax=Juglanconis juglandina TaxID=1940567 RepID=A0A291LIU1_9PEZI|nr:hypothetical protein [Juglanconis juglandina]